MTHWSQWLVISVSILLVAFGIMWLIINSRDVKSARSFIACQSLVIVWLIGKFMEITSTTLVEQDIALSFIYFAGCFLGPGLLLFVLDFTRKDEAPAYIKPLLFIPGIILFLLFLTNKEGFYFSQYNLGFYTNSYGFYVNATVTYLYIAMSLILLLRSQRAYLKQSRQMALIGMAVALPVVVHVVSAMLLQTDYTPYMFSVSAILVLVAIAKYEFMNVVPMALNIIACGLDDPIIVSDNRERIIFVNEAVAAFFPLDDEEIHSGKLSLKGLTDRIKDHVSWDQHPVVDMVCQEEAFDDPGIRIKSDSGKVYTVKKQALFDSDCRMGCVVRMHDVTMTEQLAVEKERMRLTQRLHDTMGHDLTGIMNLAAGILENPEIWPAKDCGDTAGKIVSLSKELLRNVRGCLRGYDDENTGVRERLESLIQRMRYASMPVELEIPVYEVEDEPSAFVAEVICDIVRETVTNAVRHGQAERINIIVKFVGEMIYVYVMDNGIGTPCIHKQMGLTGLERAVQSLGGRICFRSGEREGFTVRAVVPIREVPIRETEKTYGEVGM